MGLGEGSRLEVVETVDGVVLRPIESEPPVVMKDAHLVYIGKLPPGYDIPRAVDDMREERIRS